VQNVPFMARALGLGRSSDDPYLKLRKKRRPHSDCHQTCIPSALLPIGYPWVGLGRFAVLRSPMSSTRIGGASLLGIYSDLLEFTGRFYRQGAVGCIGDPQRTQA
jgi:hypothetical protein